MERNHKLAKSDFRIFIDAATLKEVLTEESIFNMTQDFRIFIDAATLKGGISQRKEHLLEQISASL